MDKLTEDYLNRSRIRIKALKFYYEQEGFADVVREAQELVELLLKAAMRNVGLEIPKVHDIAKTMAKYIDITPKPIKKNIGEITRISKYLRKEREPFFYGEEDFIPSDEYTAQDAEDAIKSAEFIYAVIKESLT